MKVIRKKIQFRWSVVRDSRNMPRFLRRVIPFAITCYVVSYHAPPDFATGHVMLAGVISWWIGPAAYRQYWRDMPDMAKGA